MDNFLILMIYSTFRVSIIVLFFIILQQKVRTYYFRFDPTIQFLIPSIDLMFIPMDMTNGVEYTKNATNPTNHGNPRVFKKTYKLDD